MYRIEIRNEATGNKTTVLVTRVPVIGEEIVYSDYSPGQILSLGFLGLVKNVTHFSIAPRVKVVEDEMWPLEMIAALITVESYVINKR